MLPAAVDFGDVVIGATGAASVVISNEGGADLTLFEPISLPLGFSLVSSFGQTTLAPGETTSFVVSVNATAALTPPPRK